MGCLGAQPVVVREPEEAAHAQICIGAIREAYTRQFNFDAWELFRDAKKREGKSGRKVVSLQPKRIDSAQA